MGMTFCFIPLPGPAPASVLIPDEPPTSLPPSLPTFARRRWLALVSNLWTLMRSSLSVVWYATLPCIIEMVKSIFDCEPFKGVNPDEAVAIGASIQGGVLSSTFFSPMSRLVSWYVISFSNPAHLPDATWSTCLHAHTAGLPTWHHLHASSPQYLGS